jgi:HAD superfamily hydrolase (TIGR01549 family)
MTENEMIQPDNMKAADNALKVVSFDVEGTMVTTSFSYAIWFEMIPQRYAERWGLSFEDATHKIKHEYDSLGDQQIDWYDVQYWFTRFDLGEADIAMEELQPRVQYYPDTKDVLEQLHGRYKLSVASGSPRPFLKHLLRDIEHHFSAIYSSTTDFQQVKTADFWAGICRDLGVEPGQIVHIGDHRQFDFLEPASVGIQAYHLDREGKSGDTGSLQSLGQLVHLLA